MNSKNLISNSSYIYAEALFKATEEIDNSLKTLSQLEEICTLFDKSPDLTIILHNPAISKNKKHEIIENIFKGSIDKKLLNFLKILIDKDRLVEIHSILSAYKELIDKKLNKKDVEIISSFELDKKQKDKIKSAVEKKLAVKTSIEWIVNSDIMAGLIFKFDDTVIDLSMKSKLESLNKNLLR